MYLWLNNIHLLFGHYKLKTLIEIIKIKFQFLFEIFKTNKDGLKYVLLFKNFELFFYLFITYIYIHKHVYIYIIYICLYSYIYRHDYVYICMYVDK